MLEPTVNTTQNIKATKEKKNKQSIKQKAPQKQTNKHTKTKKNQEEKASFLVTAT